MTASVRYVFDGQSLIYAPCSGLAWPDWFMGHRPFGESYRVAVGGTTLAERSADTSDVDPLLDSPIETRFVNDGGQSDLITSNLTSSQLLTAFENYNDARRSAGADLIIMPTMAAASSAWFTSTENGHRLDFNAAILEDPAAAGADLVIDTASLTELQDPMDTEWFYDQLHFTAAAAELVGEMWALAGV